MFRLAFKLNLTRDAVAQFRRHMDNFKSRTGNNHSSQGCIMSILQFAIHMHAYCVKKANRKMRGVGNWKRKHFRIIKGDNKNIFQTHIASTLRMLL